MPNLDVLIAGVTCREVLADLSAYVDGELGPERVRQLEAHVSACGTCASFGGSFGRMLTALRQNLQRPAPIDHEVARRLHARIAALGRSANS